MKLAELTVKKMKMMRVMMKMMMKLILMTKSK